MNCGQNSGVTYERLQGAMLSNSLANGPWPYFIYVLLPQLLLKAHFQFSVTI